MDKAASPNKIILRNIGECGQITNIDRCFRLCTHRDHKKRLGIKENLYTILQVLSITVFEKTPLVQAVTGSDHKTNKSHNAIQLKLFD